MKTITEKEFTRLIEFVKDKYGVDLTKKKSLVTGRLRSYLTEKNFSSFTDYINLVMTDKTGNEVTNLINKLTTNYTFFMRESDHFAYFKNVVLPYLEQKEALTRDLRIWSAGCSSGQEPYTLAMILADYFGLDKGRWDTKILATDISNKVLDIATKGIYPEEAIASLQKAWSLNYFKKHTDDSVIVSDRIKNEVIFRKFNLMNENFPFKKRFHVIFCRNVMIYFDAQTKHKLVDKFYEYTEPGGFLFIGHSEALNRNETKYKYIMPAVYRKE